MKASTDGAAGSTERATSNGWTFFSNYGHILLALAQDPAARLRDLAERVGITERAVHRLLSEMESAGVITRHREGRRNSYSIRRGGKLRHPIEHHRTVGDLIDLIAPPLRRGAKRAAGSAPSPRP
ncbi:MAG: winged helix-turn-helix domain-containing protein [Candidatus Binatia bacterium]|nr:winged helix-turn-helix domain-containing protein [Candidatus Binatia bacterium]